MVAAAVAAFALAQPAILVFTKTAGYRHASIPAARQAVGKIGKERGWSVWLSENPAVFEPKSLGRFDAVVFLLTSGDVLNAAQQSAFEDYISGGGGYVGVHSAADTEYDWPFYGKAVGAYFKSHPKIQKAKVRIENRNDPSVSFLPVEWVRTDEWYCYKENPRGKATVLATLDEGSYQGGTMGKDHPIMWRGRVGQGKTWYTGMGHTDASYEEANFLRSLAEGIASVLRSK